MERKAHYGTYSALVLMVDRLGYVDHFPANQLASLESKFGVMQLEGSF